MNISTEIDEVFIHPGSINFNTSEIKKEGWLVYSQKQYTTRLYMYDTTVVTPLSLSLTAKQFTYDYDLSLLVLDDWMRFKTTPEVFTLIKMLRKDLDGMLKLMFENPANPDLVKEQLIVVEAIKNLLAWERPTDTVSIFS